jgi:hypothetical protein
MAIDPVINSTSGKDSVYNTIAGGMNGQIFSWLYDESTGVMYVAGAFTALKSAYSAFSSDGSVSRYKLGAFDPSGRVSNFNAVINGDVSYMLLRGNTLYLGGTFTTVNGVSRNCFAAVDKTTGSLLSYVPDPLYSSGYTNVFYMFYDSTNNILHINDSSSNHMALDGTTGLFKYNASVYDGTGDGYNYGFWYMALSGESIYATTAGGGTNGPDGGALNSGMIKFGATTGTPDYTFNPTIIAGTPTTYTSAPYTFQILGSTLYMFGIFNKINGVTRNSIAAVSTSTGALVSWYPTVNDFIYDATYNGNFYIAGRFSSVNGVSMYGFAGIDSSGNLISSNNLNSSIPTYNQIYKILQNITNGVIQMSGPFLGNYKKVWDTRYKVARN